MSTYYLFRLLRNDIFQYFYTVFHARSMLQTPVARYDAFHCLFGKFPPALKDYFSFFVTIRLTRWPAPANSVVFYLQTEVGQARGGQTWTHHRSCSNY